MEQIAMKAKNGDPQAEMILLEMVDDIASWLARKYYAPGYDRQDIYQEAMLAAWKAIKFFDPTISSWKTIAAVCMKNHIFTLIKESKRKKNYILQIALHNEIMPNLMIDPLDIQKNIIDKDFLYLFCREGIEGLSTLEKQCILLIGQGVKLGEIAEMLQLPYKSVDNAVNRARRKVYEWKRQL